MLLSIENGSSRSILINARQDAFLARNYGLLGTAGKAYPVLAQAWSGDGVRISVDLSAVHHRRAE